MKRTAHWLRRIADRIDRAGAPKCMSYAFTFELHRGIVVREGTGQGCPLWYYGDADYERAHAEADSERPVFIQEEHGRYGVVS